MSKNSSVLNNSNNNIHIPFQTIQAVICNNSVKLKYSFNVKNGNIFNVLFPLMIFFFKFMWCNKCSKNSFQTLITSYEFETELH